MNTAPVIRRFGATASALVIATLGFVMLADKASSQTAESFRDDFSSISYSGNNGTMNWSGSWQESGESNGPTAGNVRVTASDRCFGGSGNCLRIGSDGGDLANHGVSRTANLDNASSATLSFRYRRQTQGQVPGSVTVQVSGNGGGSWSTLTTIKFAGPQKASSATFDISGKMGSATVVRFRGSGSGINGYLHIDTIEIAADMVPSATTTTSPATTTTVPETPTTTTTAPGTPTTTTTAPGTPTTTLDGSQTTTTQASTSPGTTPTTTSPTSSDTTTRDAPDDATVSAAAASGDSQDGSSTNDDLTPMTIAVETVSANAITLVLLALLASGLAIAGIERKKGESAPKVDTDFGPESLEDNE